MSASLARTAYRRPGRPPARRRRRTGRRACLCTPMWSIGVSRQLGRRAVDQLAAQVLLLQHLPEPLHAPVGDQELQPGAVAQPAVAVVAEDPDHAGPDVRHLGQRHPHAESLGEHRVGGQAAADPQVEAGAVLRVDHAEERDVVGLVRHVRPARRSTDLNLRGRLEYAWSPTYRSTISPDRRGRVDDLVGADPRPPGCRARPAGMSPQASVV